MNLFQILTTLAGLILGMIFHEFAHGWVAYKLGDATAKSSGRLTLNPIAHIDLYGTVILPMIIIIISGGQYVFGAAKPVPINYQALRNPKRDIIFVGISGPMANFIFAGLISLVIRLVPLNQLSFIILERIVFINIFLGVFNLLPIPPLDGSRILFGLLPENMARVLARIEPYGFFIVMILFLTGLFRYIVLPFVAIIYIILMR